MALVLGVDVDPRNVAHPASAETCEFVRGLAGEQCWGVAALLFDLSSVLEVFATRERVRFLSLGWLGWLGWLAVGGVLRGAGADGRHHSDEQDLEAERHS
eukprot:COSAG01_NODE_1003_length_12216_cov_8.565350_15_plen_100_part_00